MHQQIATIKVEDGVVITDTLQSAAYWLKRAPWDQDATFWRVLDFPGRIVPECYAWVLEHQGVTYTPEARLIIHYELAAFRSICEREVQSGSPHFLDGERSRYFWQPIAEPEEEYNPPI